MSILHSANTKSPKGLSKETILLETSELTEKIGDLQHALYARKKQSVLIILQGMDGSGKDGTTSAVFQHTTPGALHVYSFKKPTEEEKSHDFLWRIHKQTPAKGYIQIFNRSHYEDVLIHWVHSWINDKKRDLRMQAINVFEEMLVWDNDTIILKFFLHISKDRQKEKLLERVQNPKKQWKHADQDWEERKHWDKYMEAYDYVLKRSTIPWTIVPADQSWYRNYIVAQKVYEALSNLDLSLPPLQTNLKID